MELRAWQSIVDEAPLGVLTKADRGNVAIAARLTAEMEADFAGFPTSRLALLNKMLGQFGMSPADRAKLSIPQEKNENSFAALNK
jgi:hypothetical protein